MTVLTQWRRFLTDYARNPVNLLLPPVVPPVLGRLSGVNPARRVAEWRVRGKQGLGSVHWCSLGWSVARGSPS